MFEMAEHGSEHSTAARKAAGDAVEPLRQRTLAAIARLLAAIAIAAVLPALFILPSGQYIPFATAIAALATGFAVMVASERPGGPKALPILLSGMALIGAAHAVLNPALADFGLATATLVPVLAALLGDRRAQRLGWILLVSALAVSAASRALFGDMPQAQLEAGLIASVATYLVCALIVAITALRLGAMIEQAEKAQTDTFRELIDSFRYVVMRLSPEGQTLFASRSAETLFGCRSFELGGSGLGERVHVQDRPAFLTALSDAARAGRPGTIETRMRKDDAGSTALPSFVWLECGFSPVKASGKGDEPREVMLLLRDISERVAQREEMNRARLAAQEASEAKSRFLATIGHELRTPLNAIVGFSDMMRNGLGGNTKEAQREYADLIHKSGMHLLDTVNMLLDMSKIEAGKFEVQIDEFAPESLLGPSIAMLEPMARTRRIGISVDIGPNLPRIRGDERAYRQVAINLLSNAIKFSNPGEEVHVGLERRGRHVALTVTDKGIGMAPDVIARLGEPFFQANGGLNRKFEGSGLGLSIVKGLIDLHEGRLEVSSRPGKGTIMTVLMPISGPVAAQPPKPVVTALSEARTDSHFPQSARRSAAL
ncbi:MAG: PAS domain-containing sensor histidine kinase [Alphaproteobacteria bacterium]|nr:PAS domain-containing sensor histidine kinase [Alphaproteobacteria bacterium]